MISYGTATSCASYAAPKTRGQFTDQVITVIKRIKVTVHQVFLFSHLGHHRAMSRAPCALQQVLISYLFHTQQYMYICQSRSPNSAYPLFYPGVQDCSLCGILLCCALSLSHVRLFATQWTVAHQGPLSMGILHARIVEWVAIPFSRGSSQSRN